MNTKTLLLGSLAGNVLLSAGLLALWQNPLAIQATTTTLPHPASPARTADRGKTIAMHVTNETVTTVNWRIVESEDYRKYIANLRAIGCPEETIRDIIIADVNKLFASRHQQLAGQSQDDFKFWKKGRTLFRGLDEERIKRQKELALEKQALVKELLGIDYVDNTSTAEAFNPFSDMLGFLSPEKRQQVAELEATFVARQQKIMENRGNSRPTDEEMRQLRALEREKEAAIAQALTPQEFEDYQLRASQTAQALRATLGDFEATEQEFREMFKARKAYDEEFSFSSNNDDDPAVFAKRIQARAAVEDQIRQSLGDDRFRQWDYESQYASSSLRSVAEEHNIPRERVYEAFDVRKEAQRAAAELLSNNALNEAQRQAALGEVRSVAEDKWRQLLGPEGYEKYSRRGSRWLDEISAAPKMVAK